ETLIPYTTLFRSCVACRSGLQSECPSEQGVAVSAAVAFGSILLGMALVLLHVECCGERFTEDWPRVHADPAAAVRRTYRPNTGRAIRCLPRVDQLGAGEADHVVVFTHRSAALGARFADLARDLL